MANEDEQADFTSVPINQCTLLWQTNDTYVTDLIYANLGVYESEEWYIVIGRVYVI